jgi:signal transduction histidine kinase
MSVGEKEKGKESRSPAPVAARPPAPSKEPLEVLVVDDREENLRAVEAVLDSPSVVVVRARSGEEALRRLLDRNPAVLVLDVQMPGLDGFETAELVRARDRNRHTPILFLSAYTPDDAALRRGYALGAVDYLVKPVNPDVLRSKIAIFLELERRRRREENALRELERSNAHLSRFAQSAAHDLEAPLHGVTEGLRAIDRLGGDALPPEARTHLQRSLDDTDRMRRLIRSILEYARARTEPPEPQTVDADEVLDEALLALRAGVWASGARITREPLPRIRVDPTGLLQVFQNLLDNAIKFRGASPPAIHVSCARTGDRWLLSVRDHGPGIPAADHERAFEPFRRLHHRADLEGSGLGLAICREIVERHGGRIWIDSPEGGGTDVRFTLLAVEGDAKEPGR